MHYLAVGLALYFALYFALCLALRLVPVALAFRSLNPNFLRATGADMLCAAHRSAMTVFDGIPFAGTFGSVSCCNPNKNAHPAKSRFDPTHRRTPEKPHGLSLRNQHAASQRVPVSRSQRRACLGGQPRPALVLSSVGRACRPVGTRGCFDAGPIVTYCRCNRSSAVVACGWQAQSLRLFSELKVSGKYFHEDFSVLATRCHWHRAHGFAPRVHAAAWFVDAGTSRGTTMIKATAGLFFAFAWLALGAPLVNAQSEMEKSKKQVCLEKCSETRMAECNGGVRFDPFSSHQKKAQAVKNCEKQLSACRGKCGSYEGTRVIRR